MKAEEYTTDTKSGQKLHVKRVQFDELQITEYQHGEDLSRHYLGSIHDVTEITKSTRSSKDTGKVTHLEILHRDGSSTRLSLFHTNPGE
jgi:hypothetical protein